MILVRLESTVGRSGGSHLTLRHVVAEHLHAVHIHDNTELVVQLHLVGSHVGNAGEVLAEVLRARSSSRVVAQRHVTPARLRETRLIPVGGNVRGTIHLPLLVLLHGVEQRQRVLLLHLLHHEVLEHHVAVEASNAHPRASEPRVTARSVGVDHLECVLVVRAGGQTVLVRPLLVVCEGGTRHQHRRSRQNLVRLLAGPGRTLLRHGHVDLVRGTRQRAHYNRHYE